MTMTMSAISTTTVRGIFRKIKTTENCSSVCKQNTRCGAVRCDGQCLLFSYDFVSKNNCFVMFYYQLLPDRFSYKWSVRTICCFIHFGYSTYLTICVFFFLQSYFFFSSYRHRTSERAQKKVWSCCFFFHLLIWFLLIFIFYVYCINFNLIFCVFSLAFSRSFRHTFL